VGYAFELSIQQETGAFTGEIDSFTKPMLLSFRLPPGENNVDWDKVGIYRFNEKEGTWDYVGGKLDRRRNAFQVNLNSFSQYCLMEYQMNFEDLNGHWAANDIGYMTARHLVGGTSAKTFQPNKAITRAELAALLQRMLKLPLKKQAQSPFRDVRESAWYYDSVNTAADAGLITGYGADRFCPESPVTRQEMAAMLTRALTLKGHIFNATDAEVQSALEVFPDQAKIAPWARSVFARSVQLGIIRGSGGGLCLPASGATRAEAVVMLKRLYLLLDLDLG
jgi:hypothetical protein